MSALRQQQRTPARSMARSQRDTLTPSPHETRDWTLVETLGEKDAADCTPSVPSALETQKFFYQVFFTGITQTHTSHIYIACEPHTKTTFHHAKGSSVGSESQTTHNSPPGHSQSDRRRPENITTISQTRPNAPLRTTRENLLLSNKFKPPLQ
jgi:hypothetical protein